jgi:hypothetical protein
MKANLRKRPEESRPEFAFKELARDPAALASLEIELPVTLVAHRPNSVLVTRACYDLCFRYLEVDALRPEQFY